MFRKQQSPCEGDGGGGDLKFEEKKMLENNKVHWAYVPMYFVLFHSPKPNNIGPARQQPMDLGSLLISLSLVGGGGHSYFLLALRLLDYMGFAMEALTEWRMGGGGTHYSLTALGLGISAPPPHNTPHISAICLGLGGGTKVFFFGVGGLGHSWSLRGGTCPPGPPLGPALLDQSKYGCKDHKDITNTRQKKHK